MEHRGETSASGRVRGRRVRGRRVRERRHVWEAQREKASLIKVPTYLDAASSSYFRRSSSSSVCVAFNAEKD